MPLVIAALLALGVPVDTTPVEGSPVDTVPVSDQPIDDSRPQCTAYSIDGDLTPESADLEITATAYLHEGDEPLVGHGIVAVFTVPDGAVAPPPANLVTDVDGRVSIVLPTGAIGVRFVAESPPNGDCAAEPDVVSADVVRPTRAADLPRTGASEWLVTAGLATLGSGIGVLIGRGRRPRREARIRR